VVQQIFVNLPVKKLDRAITFFTGLGFGLDPRYTNSNGACVVIAPDIHVMLLSESFFRTFTPRRVSDATVSTEVIVCLSLASREEVDTLVDRAIGAGATTPIQPKDYGFMYQHGFQDLDGHLWELIHVEAPPG
jgi:uncharacterized protein